MTEEQREAMRATFLEEWPIQRVKRMTIEEYSNREKTSFVYWIEFKHKGLGSIQGGSSLKFKLYNRKERTNEAPRSGWKTDGEYAWSGELGETAHDAFELVRIELLFVIQAAQSSNLEAIESSTFFGPAVKWKIAAMYGAEHVYPVFKLDLALKVLSQFDQENRFRPNSLFEAQECFRTILGPPLEGSSRFHDAFAAIDISSDAATPAPMNSTPELDVLHPALGAPWLALPSAQEWRAGLQFAHELLQKLTACEDDPRLVVNLRGSAGRYRFAVVVGQQVIYSLEWLPDNQECIHRFQQPMTDTPVVPPLALCTGFQPAKGEAQMVKTRAAVHDLRPEWIQGALEVARIEWARMKSSPYRHHVPFMLQVVAEPALHERFIAFVRAPWGAKLLEVYKRVVVERGNEEREKLQVLTDFRRNWDLEAADFSSMRSVLKFESLVHPTTSAFWNVLFTDSDRARQFFRDVLNDSIPVEARLERAQQEGLAILRAHRPDWDAHSQDERTLSLLWAALDPSRHVPYKSSMYRAYCERVGLKPRPAKQAYAHYVELMDAFIAEFVAPDEALIEHGSKQLGIDFQNDDPKFHLLGHRIWSVVIDQIWTAPPDSMASPSDNPAPEVFLIDGKPFDPEAFTGTYWLLKAGESGRFWEQFRSEGFAGIGYDNWPDLQSYASREAIAEDIPHREPEWTGNNYNHTLAMWEFSRTMQPGDVVIAAAGRHTFLGVGVVQSAYRWVEGGELAHRVDVDWVRTGHWESKSQLAQKTLLNISKYDAQHSGFWPREILNQIFNNLAPNSLPEGNFAQSDLNFLADSFFDETSLQAMLTALRVKKNIILQGPPGTGKTFLAKRLAHALMGAAHSDRITTVQFHQSYSYEDFIQGFRPSEDKGFERRDGVFYRFCARARQDPEHDYFFVIDEINRGNLSKIFGELMMLIEADKRGPDHAVELTYSEAGEQFWIPENVHVIGTMNTADRSLALVDYALRRRFAFFDVQPQFTVRSTGAPNPKLRSHLHVERGISEAWVDQILTRMAALNEAIRRDPSLGEGFEIGHSYFCHTPDGQEQQWYRHIIDHEVGPQLREFWFDNKAEAEAQIQKLLA